jgi:hypothetical protein
VIVTGAGPAWADDTFGLVRLGAAGQGGEDGVEGGGGVGGGGGVDVALVKPCSRCTVPLVEQESGVVTGKEPIKTMQGFRCGRLGGERQTVRLPLMKSLCKHRAAKSLTETCAHCVPFVPT